MPENSVAGFSKEGENLSRMAQFPGVRSYVLNVESMFLATMADGSIIEFEKAPQVP